MRFNILACCLITVLLFKASFAEIIISEVMYDPAQSESYNEWVELYNNGSEDIDVSNWTLCENKIFSGYVDNFSGSVFLENGAIITRGGYAVITDGGSGTLVYSNFNVSNESTALHVDAASICGGLSNSGKELVLFDGEKNKSIFYQSISSEGYSAELVDGVWVSSIEYGGTPGRKNTAIIQNQSNESDDLKEELKIAINISAINLTLGDILNVDGVISTTFLSEKSANLTIKVAREIGGNWKYKWILIENENVLIYNDSSISNILEGNVSWHLPADLIKGNYKALATLEYDLNGTGKRRYGTQEFYVNGLEDLGEENLTIISYPKSMGFGDIAFVIVKFDSNNYNFNNLSFVAYVYSPRWASIDLNDNTLMSRPYESGTAVRLEKIERGTTTYITLPLLTKRNCEGDYEDGNYKVKVKAFDSASETLEQNVQVHLSSTNEAMCPKTIVKSSSKSEKSGVSAISAGEKEKEENEFSYDEVAFQIEIPETVSEGFEVNITAKNPTNITKKFEVWSYIFSGNKAVGDRLENKKDIIVESNKTEILRLKNTFKNGSLEEKDYKVMVKINSSNRKSEKSFSKQILITKGSGMAKDFPEIISFYTKAKKYSEKINLFANCNGSGEYFLALESFDERQTKKCEKQAQFEVKIKDGPNLFFLSVQDNQTAYGVKKLLIIANETDILSYSDSASIYDMIDSYNSIKNSYTQNLFTGSAIREPVVVYQSSNYKLKKLIKYLVPSVFLLGILMIIRGRKNG